MTMKFKDIICDNPNNEVWKQLRYFHDIDSVTSQIIEIQKVEKNHKNNVSKQASQISHCLRQAEEYYLSSNQVSLATRPLLLYYGSVSLSQALILFKKNGEFSIDALRNNERHNHHGLDFKKKFKSSKHKYNKVEDFFKILDCTVHIDNVKKIPWGHFPLFYDTIITDSINIKNTIRFEESHLELQSNSLMSYPKSKTLDKLSSKNLNALDLFCNIPDLYNDLIQFKVNSNLCPGNISQITTRHILIKANDVFLPRDITEQFVFLIYNLNEDKKKKIISHLEKNNKEISFSNTADQAITGQFQIKHKENENITFFLPDIVDSINGHKYFLINPENYINELSSMHILLFIFGMLSRYFPDVWMDVINKNILISEILNSLLNIISRKYPNFILNQITGIKHYYQISNN